MDKLFLFNGREWQSIDLSFKPGAVIAIPGFGSGNIPASFFVGNEILSYDHDYITISDLQGAHSTIRTAEILYGTGITASLKDHAGNIWLGSGSFGLFMLRNYPFELINFHNNEPITHSSHAFIDTEGIIWFDNGLRKHLGMTGKLP